MKNILLLFLLATFHFSRGQSVGIGTTNPNASAVLDVQSNNKGFLIPRMTTAQRKAIVNPEPGLMVFDTDKRSLFMFEYPNWGQLTFRATDWMEPASRLAPDGETGDNFGHAVAMSGDYAVAGAPEDDIGSNISQGSVYVFHRINGIWIQEAKIVASDGGIGDQFGYSIAMIQDTILVGAPFDSVSNIRRGSAYVFIRSGTNWIQQTKLFAPDGGALDEFGSSLSLNTYFALIGAPGDDIGSNANQGSAYLFTRSGNIWTLTRKLTATGGAANDEFGSSVSVDLNFAIVGSPKDDIAGTDNGSAHIFWGSSVPAWSSVQTLGTTNSIHFGTSVFIKGDNAIVSYGSGAFGAYSKSYTRGGFGIWLDDTPNDPIGPHFHYIINDFMVTGFYNADVGPYTAQGYVLVSKKTDSLWTSYRTIHDPTGLAFGYFGSGVAMDGFNVIIGAKGKYGSRGQVYFVNIE